MKMHERGATLLMIISLALCGCLAARPGFAQSSAVAGTNFPRLFGINISAKNYDDPAYQNDLAKLDVVVLGFYRGWKGTLAGATIGDVVSRLKSMNPQILVGQYSIMSETGDDPADLAKADSLAKVTSENWWARNAAGNRVQWTTAFNAYEVNFTAGAAPDLQGQRYSQWMPERDYSVFFSKVPFDLWYFDNVMWRPRVTADWNRDGTDDLPDDPSTQIAYRQGHAAEWQRAKELSPSIITIGNADNDLGSNEYRGKLQGAFLECSMGLSWSIETWGGWAAAMARYTAALNNTAEPKIVVFHVCGNPQDYRLFRYGFTSTLMRDGYFSFSKDYSSVAWFDEYGVDLGQAIDSPPLAPDGSGIYRRRFDHGIVLLNPTAAAVTVPCPAGYQRISGTQDPVVNSGVAGGDIRLAAKDGIVLIVIPIPKPANLRITAPQ